MVQPNAVQPPPLPTLPDPKLANVWYHCSTSETAFVFVHGIFSDVLGCWLYDNPQGVSQYWPDLVRRDRARLGDPSIFLGGFPTSIDAGEIGVRACAVYLKDGLATPDADLRTPPMGKRNLVFICHSTGGLVVRYMLADNYSEFQDKNIGLLLIASPSYGSRWANLVAFVARLYNQQLGQELAWAGPIVKDLDSRFKQTLQYNRLRHFWGQEAYETQFVVHRRWLPPRLLVVKPESAGRYFADPRPLHGLDHFGVVKPDSLQHESHKVLVSFYQEYVRQTGSSGGSPPTAPQSGIQFRDEAARSKPFTTPPQPLSPFIERAVFREAKQRLIDTGTLALKGMVGTGKTAIAMRLSYDTQVLERYSDGVLWVGLGPEPNVLGLLGGWCAALDMTPPEIASLRHVGDRQEAIRKAIASRKILIVVDDAWNKDAARTFLLGGSGSAHIVTTRFPVYADEIAGASSAITVSEMSDEESLRLIESVAPGIKQSERPAVTELIHAVGGLPAALTLIGRYLHDQRDRPDRVQRAAIQLRDWTLSAPPAPLVNPGLPEGTWVSISALIGITYQLLSQKHRCALRHLAFFPPKPNSFSEAAALSVSGNSLEVLDRLRTVGLLTGGGPARYSLHRTIVEYARKFGPPPDAATSKMLVEFFVNYLETHATEYGAINSEAANISSALQIAWDEELFALFVRGANTFGAFLDIRGFYEEAQKLFDRAVQAASSAGTPSDRLAALLNRGRFAEKRGEYPKARQDLVESLDLARQQEDPARVAAAISSLAIVLSNLGSYAEAESLLREGLALPAEQVGPETRVDLLSRLAVLANRRGPDFYAECEALNLEGLKLAEQVGSRERMCFLLTNLAILDCFRGDLGSAHQYATRGLALAEQIGHSERQAGLLQALGLIAKAQGNPGEAEEWLRRALAVARGIHHEWYASATLNVLGEVLLGTGRPLKARECFMEALNTLSGPSDLRGHSTFGLAQVAETVGDRESACRLGRESLADFERMKDQTAEAVHRWLKHLACNA
jgi:tetratricopeptide (TPR) repeat protein